MPVLEKARESCFNSNQAVSDHFEEMLDMIDTGKGAKRQVDSVKLSRYACYLIVQNADPSKEVVAIGQTYFAVQTRIQEITQIFFAPRKQKKSCVKKRLKENKKPMMPILRWGKRYGRLLKRLAVRCRKIYRWQIVLRN